MRDGTVLNGTLAFVHQMEKLVRIFNDKRPISTMKDERINQLREALVYFETFTGKPKKQSFTSESLYDIICCITGFLELVSVVVKRRHALVPAFLNSDIVENHFSYVRTLYNGANDNPTYANYCDLQNSIILTQPMSLPGKRNANCYVKYPSSEFKSKVRKYK